MHAQDFHKHLFGGIREANSCPLETYEKKGKIPTGNGEESAKRLYVKGAFVGRVFNRDGIGATSPGL